MAKKQIRVTEEQREQLHGMKRVGEDYADVVGRLLEQHDETIQTAH